MRLLTAIVASIAVTAFSTPAYTASAGAKDIVVQVERDGNAFSVNAQFTVAATVDEVWDVLTDFDTMAEILSNVDASRIVNRDGNRFEVIQKSHASAGLVHLSLDSVRQVELTPKREIRSHLIKGDLKSSDFKTQIDDDGAGVVKVSVSGKFVPSALGAAAITPDVVQTQTRRQYQELRDEILRRKAHEPRPPCVIAKNCTAGTG